MKGKKMNRKCHSFAFALKATALACLGALIVAPLAWSQSIETGAIVGSVIDEQGAILPGTTVVLSSPSQGTSSTLIADQYGKFRFMSIVPGTYNVDASLDGFSTARQSNVVVTVTKTLTVDFVMAIGAFEEVIEVVGTPLIDTTESTLATMEIPNELLMDVPTARDIRSIVGLGQGVTADADGERFSAYGSSTQGIQYSVDGVVINSPEAGETEWEMDFDNLEEVSILGIGAPAEYDGFSGVIVNAVTKSGTNEFHGMASLYYNDSDWASSNTSNPDLQQGGAKSTTWEVPFNIGGPIIQDKLFFFAAYEKFETTVPSNTQTIKNIAGVEQAGYLRFRVADLTRDMAIMNQARSDAFDLLERDPTISSPESASLCAAFEAARASGRQTPFSTREKQ